jgi:hypothetical protein
VPEHDGGIVVARVGRQPGETLVKNAGQRVLVSAPVDLLPLDLLGGDVGERADHLSSAREPGTGRRTLRQAEVDEVDVLALGCSGQEDVRGLDVAVDQPLGMRGVQSLGDLLDDRDDSFRRDPALFP